MDTALQIAAVILPLLYLLAAVCYGFLFFARHPRAERLAGPLLLIALGLHLGNLVLTTMRWHQLPAATVSQTLSMIAFAIAAVYALLEWLGKERGTGFLMAALAFFFQLLSSLLRTGNPPDREIFHNPLFATHVSLALIGYAAFAIAAAYGFLFLRLYRELKRGRFSFFFGRLPPLEVLERMMVGALMVGFVALFGTVVSGAIWAEQLFTDNWLSDPKIGFTAATLVLYGVALLLRRMHHWHGRQTAIACLTGFGAILFSIVAINLFFTELHGFF